MLSVLSHGSGKSFFFTHRFSLQTALWGGDTDMKRLLSISCMVIVSFAYVGLTWALPITVTSANRSVYAYAEVVDYYGGTNPVSVVNQEHRSLANGLPGETLSTSAYAENPAIMPPDPIYNYAQATLTSNVMVNNGLSAFVDMDNDLEFDFYPGEARTDFDLGFEITRPYDYEFELTHWSTFESWWVYLSTPTGDIMLTQSQRKKEGVLLPGSYTLIASSAALPDDLYDGIEFNLQLNGQPVPEPTTILLVGTGLVGFAVPRIRQKFKK